MIDAETRDRRAVCSALCDELDHCDELFDREIFDTIKIAHQRHQALQSNVGPREAFRHQWAPLRHGFAADPMNLSRAFAGENVPVAIMLVFGAKGIFPIVENLASQNMPADAPRMTPAAIVQDTLAHADRIRIDDLVGAVSVAGLETKRHRQRMMVRRLVAEIEPEESDCRRSVRQNTNVARDESEVLRVPGAHGLVVGNLENDMAELDDFGRMNGGPLSLIDTDYFIRSVEPDRAAMRQRLRRRLVGDRVNAKARRIHETDAAPAAWRVDILDVRRARDRG